ncbi:MAG: DUF2589 domain-containing protein [Bacteroidaceae bacterium]|nr:DUF2589 domain-containing protein [Bacteroidaceae bacterium]
MSVADKAISSMSAIPFEDIIGGPLNACIDAQTQAAVSTVNFIKSVGLNTTIDPNTGAEKSEAVYVYFSFIKAGRRAVISVPLLAIVPIPYIAINTIDISFKASITGTDSTSSSDEYSSTSDQKSESSSKKGGGWLTKKKTSKMTSTISSKRDSKATQDSTFSIEATIDVEVHAGQESMPAGMAKLLEMLNSAMDLVPESGELVVSESSITKLPKQDAKFVVSYKGSDGINDPSKVLEPTFLDNNNKEVKYTKDTDYTYEVNYQSGMVTYTIKKDATVKVKFSVKFGEATDDKGKKVEDKNVEETVTIFLQQTS